VFHGLCSVRHFILVNLSSLFVSHPMTDKHLNIKLQRESISSELLSRMPRQDGADQRREEKEILDQLLHPN